MMKNNHQAILYCLSVCLSIVSVNGQDLDSLLDLNAYTEESDLQKILNKNVTISSRKALTTRETPGIISLITEEEIQNAGARDLIDVLRMVPGFDVMQDLQFVMGIGLRGNWANEGKVLVMMDGQPFNELLYQTVAVGNRFPVDAIERIEIVRGPGSALYGGSAEYGVINIITKAAENLHGAAVYGTGGFHAGATGRTNAGIMAAQKGQNFSWDASFFTGKAIVSDRSYFELGGTDEYDLAAATNADPLNINIGLKKGGFQLRTTYDQFDTSEPFTFVSNKNFLTDLKYEWKINDQLVVTPQIKYFEQTPWAYGEVETGEYTLKVNARRYMGGINAAYDWSRKVNINFGAVYFEDKATDLLKGGYFGGNNTLSLNNYALFAQSLIKHRLANATIGLRYERNNLYGDAFVPRFALTKKIQNFHFKILYSQAFRAPAIENINLSQNGDIKPEKSNVFELEFGYQFTPEMLLAVNVFSISTRDVIIYSVEVISSTESIEGYDNFDKSGSKGAELVYSIRKSNFYSNLSYSFSLANSNNTVESYKLPQTNRQFVGALAHKITFNTNIYLGEHFSINPTMIYGGRRYAYNGVDGNEPVANALPPYLLMNMFFNCKNLISKGLTVGAGVYDLFNQHPDIPQAYNGDYAPIPGRSREYVVKLSYQLNFNSKK